MKRMLIILATLIIAGSAQASDKHHGHSSKYAGQENRGLKSLSTSDIEELRRGGGWGLAKSAELNGVPGPAHLLELRNEIPLQERQVSEITDLYNQMKSKAVEQGKILIALERQLERHFQERTIDDKVLRSLLSGIAEAQRKLRYIHLATHLKTPMILTQAQIKRYNVLRGYSQRN